MGLPLHISWHEAALRVLLAAIAGLLIGYNRAEQGKAAGVRTTLLVCLAACLAMLQVNLLLPTVGRASDSFITTDPMRLPLGILTGVGFIGGGVIIRRSDNLVVGVTTAATLWYVTVIGLCLGAGQLALGLCAAALGLLTLWAMDWLEQRMRRECDATLRIELQDGGPDESEIRRLLKAAGLSVSRTQTTWSDFGRRRALMFELTEYRLPQVAETPAIVEALARQGGVVSLEWRRL